MAFQLEDINFKTVADPKGFIEEGDQAYKDRVAKAADKIISNRDGTCRILSAEDSSLAMTVKNGDSTNGNTIYLSEYTGSAAQHFILHRTDDAYYITGACSGNAALDVYDISHDNGADIDQWDYWGGEGQKFYIRPVDSEYRLISGDLNFDGVVDTYDRIVMEKAVRFGADEILKQVADVNSDGIVNEKDFSMLSDFLLGKKTDMQSYCDIPCSKPDAAYLFAYFLGNAPEQERLSYAISLDGYNFRALNGGKAVWGSSTGTKCIRDPYIFKGEDGLYYMLATDMKSSLGWNSNRNLLSAKSTDLVHWFDESIIEIANKYPNMQGADRAWAPQAIYDPAKGSYMIYFAARVPGTDDRTIMYYAYSKDMKKLDTTPQILFAPANGNDAIDSDIIFENSKYYMYYKNETNKRIYLAESGNASGPYKEIKRRIRQRLLRDAVHHRPRKLHNSQPKQLQLRFHAASRLCYTDKRRPVYGTRKCLTLGRTSPAEYRH